MSVEATRNGNIVDLDVRSIQEAKDEPFYIIMETIEKLNEDDELHLHAIINPQPLIRVLEGKGFKSSVEQISEKHWKIIFSRGK